MAVIKFWRGTFEQFTNLTNKDENTVYVVKDNDSTKNGIYLGSEQVATVSEGLSDEEIEQIVNDAIQGKADKYRTTIVKSFTLADVRVGDNLSGKVFFIPSWDSIDTSDWSECSTDLGEKSLEYIHFENGYVLGATKCMGFESFGITTEDNLSDDRFRDYPFYCYYNGEEYYQSMDTFIFPKDQDWIVSYVPVSFPQVMHDTINDSNSYMVEVDVDPEYNYKNNVFITSKGVGSMEIKPYQGTDSNGNPVLVSAVGASGEGAFAWGDNADARGKRSRVFSKGGVTTERAWDAYVFGQACTSDGSGNMVGGLRSINHGHYGITFGVDCETGENIRALNVGISNIMYKNTDEDYGFRFAIGTGLSVGNKKFKSALGQWNVGSSDAIFEYGNGTGPNDRKNAFDITTSSAIRQYGTHWYIKKRPDGTQGYVIIDTDVIPSGTAAIVALPTESGKLLIDKDIENKLNKVTTASTIYATNSKGEFESALKYSYDPIQYAIPRRHSGGNIIVPVTPGANNHAASKQYVDTQVANIGSQENKADKYTTTIEKTLLSEVKVGDNLKGKTIVFDWTDLDTSDWPPDEDGDLTWVDELHNFINFSNGYILGAVHCDGVYSYGIGWTESFDYCFREPAFYRDGIELNSYTFSNEDWIVTSIPDNFPQIMQKTTFSEVLTSEVEVDCEYNYNKIKSLENEINNLPEAGSGGGTAKMFSHQISFGLVPQGGGLGTVTYYFYATFTSNRATPFTNDDGNFLNQISHRLPLIFAIRASNNAKGIGYILTNEYGSADIFAVTDNDYSSIIEFYYFEPIEFLDTVTEVVE